MTPLERQLIDSIRACDPLIYMLTSEESETLRLLKRISGGLKRSLVRWNATEGFTDDSAPGAPRAMQPMNETQLLADMLAEIRQYSGDAVFALQDVNFYLGERNPPENLAVLTRTFKALKQELRVTKKTVVLIGSRLEMPSELENEFTLLTHPRPTPDELNEVLMRFVTVQHIQDKLDPDPRVREMIVSAARGLTAGQAQSCFAKAYLAHGALGGEAVAFLLDQKRQVLQRNRILEYFDADIGVDSVGGLNNLKSWLRKRKNGFTGEASSKGLPVPKGILIFGVPGSGKSLTAKAASSLWEMPLLRFDMGRVFGRYVGESETNMREALQIAEAVAPCILWIDEMEKGFSGATGGHETTTRVLGSFLTWMQEKTSAVFVIATANNVTQLPPEFLRKGRFDELFFVGTPADFEREEIFRIQLQKYRLDPGRFDLDRLVQTSKDRTGAEIEQAIVDAKWNAFDLGAEPTTEDIYEVMAQVIPIWGSFKNTIETPAYKQLIRSAKQAS